MSLSRMEAKHPVTRESVFQIHHPQQFDPALNSIVRAQIGRRLRILFEGEAAPAPDSFQELLSQIDARLGAPENPR